MAEQNNSGASGDNDGEGNFSVSQWVQSEDRIGVWADKESTEKVCKLYDDWADTYDAEITPRGYNGPGACVNILEKFLPPNDKDIRIMDIGCGTGLVGEELIKRGYKSIDGLDVSPESIKLCEEKKIYQHLICDILGGKEDIKDDTYDAIVCVGCFVPSHLNQSHFPEFVRITKPGGYIVITMRAEYVDTAPEYKDDKLNSAIQDLVQKGVWEVAAREHFDGFFDAFKGLNLVFKVL